MSNLSEKELIALGKQWLDSVVGTIFEKTNKKFTDAELIEIGKDIIDNNLPKEFSPEEKIKFKRVI